MKNHRSQQSKNKLVILSFNNDSIHSLRDTFSYFRKIYRAGSSGSVTGYRARLAWDCVSGRNSTSGRIARVEHAGKHGIASIVWSSAGINGGANCVTNSQHSSVSGQHNGCGRAGGNRRRGSGGRHCRERGIGSVWRIARQRDFRRDIGCWFAGKCVPNHPGDSWDHGGSAGASKVWRYQTGRRWNLRRGGRETSAGRVHAVYRQDIRCRCRSSKHCGN